MFDQVNSILRHAKAARTSKKDYQAATAIDLLIQQIETAVKDDEKAEKYNGWTNRETWALALHIDSNQWTHNKRHDLLSRAKGDVQTDEEYVRFLYANKLKDWVESMFETFFNGSRGIHQRDIKMMVMDVGSLWRVNWQEIADNWIRDSE